MKWIISTALVLCFNTLHAQTSDTIRQFLTSRPKMFSKAEIVYNLRNFQPLFIENGNYTSFGQQLSEVYTALLSNGLNPNDYGYIEWKNAELNPSLKTTDLEVLITDKMLLSLQHLAAGRLDPRTVSSDIKFSPKAVKIETLASELILNPLRAVNVVAPQLIQYQVLKEVLMKLKLAQKNEIWKPISPVSFKIQVGSRHSTVTAIKEKLQVLGYAFSTMDDLIDKEFISATEDIFRNMLIKNETSISVKSKLWKYLNVELGSRIQEVELQMEKLRWLPSKLEDRHGFVNLANQTIYIDDPNMNSQGHYLEFKTVNGAVKSRTPSMKDKIESVVFNPTWTMTMNIFFNEELPRIKKDPAGYFSSSPYEVIDASSDEVLNPMSIDWQNITRSNIWFTFVQPPGYYNALGVVRFSLTNPYSVYLHDTNMRRKFKNENRLLSHGCVRLERPIDLAEYLFLGTTWTRNKIESVVAKPDQIIEKPTRVSLKEREIPVYLMSLTVEVKQAAIQFYEDFYGHNQSLFKALKKAGLNRAN